MKTPNTELEQSFGVWSSFAYPFRGSGLYVILGGAIIFTVGNFLSTFLMMIGFIIQILITVYTVGFARDVVQVTVTGGDELPDWMDFSDGMSDMAEPLIEMLVVIALSFGPLIFLRWHTTEVAGWVWLAASAWGCLTFPILMLMVVLADSVVGAFHLVGIVRLLWQMFPSYLLASLICAVIAGLNLGAGMLMEKVRFIPILPALVSSAISIYLLAVLSRSIGLVYRQSAERG
jgi:hypothetical protein